jgi:hypothetical protein
MICVVFQLKNRSLSTQLEQVTSKWVALKADVSTMEVMRAVLASLGSKPDAMRTLAAMRASMQTQVKELHAASQAAEDKYRTSIATQASLVTRMHDYLDTLSSNHAIDTNDRPGALLFFSI